MTRKEWIHDIAAALIAVVLVALAWSVPVPMGKFMTPSHVQASEQTTIARKLLSNVSAINTAVATGNMGNARSCAVYADWSAGVSVGVVAVETAVDQNYTGTWAAVTNGTLTFASTAPNQNVMIIPNVLWSVRTRISTGVVGGTVNTWIVCN